MNKMKWIIFTVVVVAIFGGIIAFNKKDDKTFTGDASKAITEGEIQDHVFGSLEQKVVLIEYGDFQCPGCRSMYVPVKEVTEKYKDKLTFIFRNMPLTNIHPNALAAATAAEAAGLQGKYYEMHSQLYEAQDSWSGAPIDKRQSIFEGYASQIGLNVDQFKKDLLEIKISDKIARDKTTGVDTFKVDSTPTFVLNGTVIKGSDAVTADKLVKLVEDALKAAYGDAVVQPTTEPINAQ